MKGKSKVLFYSNGFLPRFCLFIAFLFQKQLKFLKTRAFGERFYIFLPPPPNFREGAGFNGEAMGGGEGHCRLVNFVRKQMVKNTPIFFEI